MFTNINSLRDIVIKLFKKSKDQTYKLAIAFIGAKLFKPTNKEEQQRNKDSLELKLTREVAIIEALIVKLDNKEDQED